MEFGIPEHKSKKVQIALTRLLDELCTWERETGRRSVLILREENYVCRADSGKCVVPDYISDEYMINITKRI
jgi:hypothetical protein